MSRTWRGPFWLVCREPTSSVDVRVFSMETSMPGTFLSLHTSPNFVDTCTDISSSNFILFVKNSSPRHVPSMIIMIVIRKIITLSWKKRDFRRHFSLYLVINLVLSNFDSNYCNRNEEIVGLTVNYFFDGITITNVRKIFLYSQHWSLLMGEIS